MLSGRKGERSLSISKTGRINSHEGSAIRLKIYPLVRQNASQKTIETCDDITNTPSCIVIGTLYEKIITDMIEVPPSFIIQFCKYFHIVRKNQLLFLALLTRV